MSIILGIESTCDETAAAVVVDGRDVRSNVIASQVELHAKYRGVVPEIASRAHIENILPVIRESLGQAGCDFADVDAIAVANRPGLIGSLLIGVTAAKTLAWSLHKPLVAVDHVQAHLYSVMLERVAGGDRVWGLGSGVSGKDQSYLTPQPAPDTLHPTFPAIGLVISGGHTALYRIDDWLNVHRLGGTIDDAVGEAYDKVSAILGLGYPGGPIIDALAKEGDPKAVAFPRTMLDRESLNFSFSGLKTSVLYHVRGVPGRHQTPAKASALSLQQQRDIAASFQAACIDVLVKKLNRAIERVGARSVVIGGGVSANRGLRAATAGFSLPVCFPSPDYCTDNAAMIGGLGDVMLSRGLVASLDLDAITSSAIP